MEDIKTEKQLIIELRNKIASQIVSQRASELYWREVAKKSKKDTQEKVDSLNKVSINQQLNSKDKAYLKIIDEMLEKLNG